MRGGRVCVTKGGIHGEGGVCGRGACLAGACLAGACVAGGLNGRGQAWKDSVHGRGGGMHSRGAFMVGETATAASSTHPTVMHSCFL